MARKKTIEQKRYTKVRSISLPTSVHDEAERVAKAELVKFSWLVRRGLEMLLREYKATGRIP